MAFAVVGELQPPFRFSPLSPFNIPTRTFTLSTSSSTPKFVNTQYFTQKKNGNCSIIANSSIISPPIVSLDDLWGIWMSLFATGAFGLWSEKTKIGSMVSAALISTLVGLTGSNMGIIPYEAPAYSVVLKYPLPLTIPLLLFRENLRHVLHSIGPLLLAFLLASAGMIIGSVVAYLMVPMRSLGQDSWKLLLPSWAATLVEPLIMLLSVMHLVCLHQLRLQVLLQICYLCNIFYCTVFIGLQNNVRGFNIEWWCGKRKTKGKGEVSLPIVRRH